MALVNKKRNGYFEVLQNHPGTIVLKSSFFFFLFLNMFVLSHRCFWFCHGPCPFLLMGQENAQAENLFGPKVMKN